MTPRLPLAFIESLFETMEPDKFPVRFLSALVRVQNVERGSLWIRRGDGYVCAETVGPDDEKIRGVFISARRSSIVGAVFETGQVTVAEAGKDPRHFKEIEGDFAVKSTWILGFPLRLKDGSVYGVVEIIDTSAEGKQLNLDSDYIRLMEGFVTTGGFVLGTIMKIEEQKRQNGELKRHLEDFRLPAAIVGRSMAMETVLRIVKSYAGNDFPVLVTGESGTGKGLIAREIHRLSARRDHPFLVQNCSAIPDTLLESELFGYRKGAFSGAARDKEGLFEAVRGGTVFLDEIGEMPLALQSKILHVLQDNEVKPLGSTEFRIVDVRIISASNRDLKRAVETGQFREDLYFRLNVLPLEMPPLRDRKEDIPMLLSFFLSRYGWKPDTGQVRISQEAMEMLMEYSWPGNIREMENVVKYLLTVTQSDTILPKDLKILPGGAQKRVPATVPGSRAPLAENPPAPPETESLSRCSWEEVERKYVRSLLDRTKWNIAAASRQAGVKRSTFNARLKRLGISKK